MPVPTISKNDVIARSMTFDGRPVTVSAIEYNGELAGIGNKSFSVHVGGNATTPEQSFGFKSEDDVNRFLTSWNEEEFDGANHSGTDVKETRQGLGLADAMISRVQSKATAKPVSPVFDPNVTEKGNA